VVKRVEGKALATWHGLGLCGHIWDCPVCSARLRVERTRRIVSAVRYLGGRWQMLTLTIRHREGQYLKTLQRGLVAAWRRTRQGGKGQRLWSSHVSASARTVEVTRGPNGWHVHIHALIRTDEWTPEERFALWDRFRKCVAKELGEDHVPNYERGIFWSVPRMVPEHATEEDVRHVAHYVAKFSLEVAGMSKRARHGSRDPFDIARAAARGNDPASMREWEDFQHTMRGRRCIELDERASAAADAFEELQRLEGDAVQGDKEPAIDPVWIDVARDDVRALRMSERRRPTIMADVLAAAERSGAGGVRDWVALCKHENEAQVTCAAARRTLHAHGSEESPPPASLSGARSAWSVGARECGARRREGDALGPQGETPSRAGQAPPPPRFGTGPPGSVGVPP